MKQKLILLLELAGIAAIAAAAFLVDYRLGLATAGFSAFVLAYLVD